MYVKLTLIKYVEKSIKMLEDDSVNICDLPLIEMVRGAKERKLKILFCTSRVMGLRVKADCHALYVIQMARFVLLVNERYVDYVKDERASWLD